MIMIKRKVPCYLDERKPVRFVLHAKSRPSLGACHSHAGRSKSTLQELTIESSESVTAVVGLGTSLELIALVD